MEFRIADMRNFSFNSKFDCGISLFGSIGYLIENKDLLSSFKKIHEHLNPAGLLVFEFWNIRGVRPSHSSWLRAEDEGVKVIRVNTSEFDASECTVTLVFDTYVISGNRVIDEFTETHLIRVFSPNEIRLLLKQSGFEVLDIVEEKSFEPPNERSFRLMAIARKI